MFRGNAQLKVLVTRDEKNRALVWEIDGPKISIAAAESAQRRRRTTELSVFAARYCRRANSRCAQPSGAMTTLRQQIVAL